MCQNEENALLSNVSNLNLLVNDAPLVSGQPYAFGKGIRNVFTVEFSNAAVEAHNVVCNSSLSTIGNASYVAANYALYYTIRRIVRPVDGPAAGQQFLEELEPYCLVSQATNVSARALDFA